MFPANISAPLDRLKIFVYNITAENYNTKKLNSRIFINKEISIMLKNAKCCIRTTI